MSEALTSSTFPAATCEACGKTVLTHLVFDDTGEAQRCCVSCDSPITSTLAWLSASELETQGYQFGAPRARSGGAGSGGGCGGGQC
ncbi:MAG: hypothetical protein ACREQC_03725, partial [Candidatus Binataceae bacterium]